MNLHAAQIRQLAADHGVVLVDSLAAFVRETEKGTPLSDLMSQSNHPNARGHAIVATELFICFPNRTKLEP